jgi:hypothetical protein
MVVEKDIAYRPYGERGMLNIVVPEGEGPFPVALCVHGGGWVGGEKNGMLPFGYWLAEVGIASPQDITEGVAFLCLDAGSFISGANVPYMFR